ncbi:MAG: hypothetical protein J7L54_05060 [Elusimicrobia bacterium]|nr:hypothetical protein [Elusimicrobiota bacterium]
MMSRKTEKRKSIKSVFYLGVFLLVVASHVFAEGAAESIEGQISSILKNVFSIDKFSVTVRFAEYTEVIDLGKEKGKILPGVPIEEKLTSAPSRQLVRKNRLLITVILPKDVSADMGTRIKNLLKLALSLGKNDSLSILRENFASKPAVEAPAEEFSLLGEFKSFFLKPGNILLTALFLAIVVFLFGPVRIFMRYLAGYFANASASAMQGRQLSVAESSPQTVNLLGGGSENALPAAPRVRAEPSGPFSFVNDGNVSNLAYLLKDATSEKIAAVCGFLSEPLVEKFLSFFPPEKRSDIMSFFIYKKELPRDEISALEAELKERVDFVSGGRDHLLRMLENSPRNVQEQFLDHISEEDPILATELRNSIFHFEDIARQDTSVIRTVLRFVNTRDLAYALKFTDSDARDRILSVLSEGARAIVSEEMELLPENQAESQKQQKNIVALVRRLKESGAIEIR